jgi:trigger factor
MPELERPDPEDAARTDEAAAEENGDSQAAAEEPKLNLGVDIDRRGACQRHITVTIPRDDIQRYFDREFSELVDSAQVPGFRPGRAPRKLIEHRFRKEVKDRVKSSLLMDSIAQVSEKEELSAISEPDFDLEAVELPDEGPMTFEFDLEVRPEFDLPQWKGLLLEKPVREFSDEDVDRALQNVLARRGRLVPFDGPASTGDYVTANFLFKHEDQEISRASEEVVRIRPVLSFRDGKVEGFDALMAGVRGGETRQGEAHISGDAPNPALRGKTITAIFEVLEVKKLELPEVTPELLKELGDFETVADLRDAVKDSLQRRLSYQQHQSARQQITQQLTVAADWDLPPAMLQRQSRRELQRAVLELKRAGFGDEEIRVRENELRQNISASTARALKEHFILERIAEDQEIEPSEQDYEEEIYYLAMQSGESPRRVRARLEKGDMMDVLRNQVVERKVIELILSQAEFKEVPYKPEGMEEEALDQTVGGEEEVESEIPEAKAEPGPAEHEGGPETRHEHP